MIPRINQSDEEPQQNQKVRPWVKSLVESDRTASMVTNPDEFSFRDKSVVESERTNR
jgi:hypothetical protein